MSTIAIRERKTNVKGKNMCIYKITSMVKEIPDAGKVTVYGICAFTTKGLTYEAEESDFCFVSDISDSFERVEMIAKTLCDNRVLPVHIRDVIEDML